jgi:squalene cyclase
MNVENVDYEWQKPYAAAVLEVDDAKLKRLIEDAHDAIQLRILELNSNRMGSPEERMAIEFALNCLKVLRQEISPKRRSA